jgi:hypothetical protein
VPCTSFGLASTEGLSRLYVRCWLPVEAKEVRGIVLLVHGMAEHSGRYDGFARFLAPQGLAVDARFSDQMDPSVREERLKGWHLCVERTRMH